MKKQAKGPKFRAGDRVYDSWWPQRIGRILAVTARRIHVDYFGARWAYDSAHQQFLRKWK